MKWIDQFVLALSLDDEIKLQKLIDNLPKEEDYKSIEDMKRVQSLLLQAKSFFETRRSNALLSMNRLKKSMQYLKSTESTKQFKQYS